MTIADMNVAELVYYDPALHQSGPEFEAVEAFLSADDTDTIRDFALQFFAHLRCSPLTAELPVHRAAALAAGLVHQLMCGMGGGSLYIPSGYAGSATARKARALGMLAKGLGYRAISRELGVSEMRIRQYEKEHRAKRRADRAGP